MNEKEKKAIKNLTEYAYATYEYILKSKDAKIILNLIEKQQAELEKKDRVINEMAKYIARFDIEEDICNKIEDNCYDYAGQNGKLCDDCIKEYFKKKVEAEE